MYRVSQIARVAHPISSQDKWLLMLAYFDFSGHPNDQKVIAIGGWIGTEKQWASLEQKWWKRLRRENIDHFHMNRFESRYDPFAGWDDNRRLSLISDLLAFINNAEILGDTIAIVVEDWKKLLEDKFNIAFERKRATYVLLMQHILWKFARRVNLKNNDTIACVFEEDAFIEGALGQQFINIKKDQYISTRLGTLRFGDKKKFAPLQAADLLAYEGMKHALNQVVFKGARPIRKPLKNLRKKGNVLASYFDEVSFAKILTDMEQNNAIEGIIF